MNKKTLARIAVVMIIVFGATILLYPMLFNPDSKKAADVAAPPVVDIKQPTEEIKTH